MKKARAHKTELCPIAQASSLIGDMWVILIVRDLLKGAKRFSELQQSLIPSSGSGNPINSRTLANRLKKLENTDIVMRTAFPHEMPPKVEYSLTKKGKALSKVIDQIKHFGQEYF